MRAALLSLSLVGALAASAAAQVVVGGPPATPPVPRMQGTPRAHAIAGIPDPAWEQKVRQLADSIQIVAGELAAARLANENGDKIGALEQTLGELRGRLGGLEGQLGAMQGQLGAMHGRLAAAQARAEVRAEGRGERVVVMQQQRHPLSKGAIASLIKRMNGDPQGARLPPADSILPADFAVAAGSALGRVAALGDLDVFGTVNGDAVAL
ncbi:MAG TPA: hypothetical protein VHM30_18660, partial [Gemmatimonadaceae bacterium]|nr:hypothetical protein [Gemmatimonadaceae bacterium]